MAEWIPVYVLLAPVVYKLIQLRVLQFDRGFLYMEFGKPYHPTVIEKKTVKRPRKQVDQ
jgi:hypothetical protein